jgi:hypothetical protein
VIAPDGKDRYLCERCGGSKIQEGSYWDRDQKRYIDKGRVPCESCNGTGWLGLVGRSYTKEEILAGIPEKDSYKPEK